MNEGFVAKAKVATCGSSPWRRRWSPCTSRMLDAKTPLWVKTTVAAALAYFILPTDAIPDFLPVVGLGDDVGILTAALTAISTHVTSEHREQAQEWMEQEQPWPTTS